MGPSARRVAVLHLRESEDLSLVSSALQLAFALFLRGIKKGDARGALRGAEGFLKELDSLREVPELGATVSAARRELGAAFASPSFSSSAPHSGTPHSLGLFEEASGSGDPRQFWAALSALVGSFRMEVIGSKTAGPFDPLPAALMKVSAALHQYALSLPRGSK